MSVCANRRLAELHNVSSAEAVDALAATAACRDGSPPLPQEGLISCTPEDVPPDGTTPWERGEEALIVKPGAVSSLSGELARFARQRAGVTRATGSAADFAADATRLVALPCCRRWIAEMVQEHPGLSAASGAAAVVSVWVTLLSQDRQDLYRAYWHDVARRLGPILRYPLRAIRLHLSRDERREAVLEPMAWFFLDALGILRADPNRLRTTPAGRRRLADRPYGWAPATDPLNPSLSLLVVRRTRRHCWSNAFTFSPLGTWLRSCGLAHIVTVRRQVCPRCKRTLAGHASTERCPSCGGKPVVRTHSRLLSSRYIDEVSANGGPGVVLSLDASPLAAAGCRDAAERSSHEDGAGRHWHIAIDRARALWTSTASGSGRHLCRTAVLLSLAALDTVPGDDALRSPDPDWLRSVVMRFLDDATHRHAVAERARRLLPGLCERFGVARDVTLTLGHTSTILSRFKQRLIG